MGIRIDGRGNIIEIQGPTERNLKRPIAVRPRIRATKREEEVALRRPGSDTAKRRESTPRFAVGECRHTFEIDGPGLQPVCQGSAVVGFLPTEPDGPQPTIAESGERGRSDCAQRLLEPAVCGGGRRQRDLLLEDQVDQRAKTGLTKPGRRCAVAFDEDAQVGIDLSEVEGDVADGGILESERDGRNGAAVRSKARRGHRQSRFSLIRVALPTRSRK